jgi:hypothetical protein
MCQLLERHESHGSQAHAVMYVSRVCACVYCVILALTWSCISTASGRVSCMTLVPAGTASAAHTTEFGSAPSSRRGICVLSSPQQCRMLSALGVASLQIAYGGLVALTAAMVLKWATLEARRFQKD